MPNLGTPNRSPNPIPSSSGDLSGTLLNTLGVDPSILGQAVNASLQSPAPPDVAGLGQSIDALGMPTPEAIPGTGRQALDTILNTVGGLLQGDPSALVGGFLQTRKGIEEIRQRNREMRQNFLKGKRDAQIELLQAGEEQKGKIPAGMASAVRATADLLDATRRKEESPSLIEQRGAGAKLKDVQADILPQRLQLDRDRLASLDKSRKDRSTAAMVRLRQQEEGLEEKKAKARRRVVSVVMSAIASIGDQLVIDLQEGTGVPTLETEEGTIEGRDAIEAFIRRRLRGVDDIDLRGDLQRAADDVLEDLLDEFE